MAPRDVLCPTCRAPRGSGCCGPVNHALGELLGRPCAFHAERVISSTDRRFVTDQGQRLHRLASHDVAAATRAGRCGKVYADTFEVPRGSALMGRLVDCGACAVAMGSVQ